MNHTLSSSAFYMWVVWSCFHSCFDDWVLSFTFPLLLQHLTVLCTGVWVLPPHYNSCVPRTALQDSLRPCEHSAWNVRYHGFQVGRKLKHHSCHQSRPWTICQSDFRCESVALILLYTFHFYFIFDLLLRTCTLFVAYATISITIV